MEKIILRKVKEAEEWLRIIPNKVCAFRKIHSYSDEDDRRHNDQHGREQDDVYNIFRHRKSF